MKAKNIIIPAVAGVLAVAGWATTAVVPKPEPDGQIARGRHLVENVALCADCHSPRRPNGEFDRERWLMGATVPFKPTVEMPWVTVAPPIAGLPGYTDEQAVTLLTTGVRPNGTPPIPPMPVFKLHPAEARAVVAYLRSIAPAK